LNFSIASGYTKFSILRKSLNRLSDREKSKKPEEQAENLNVRAAVIHMLGDAITSIGVIIASLIIYFKPEYKIADPLITFVFSVIVLFTTLPVVNDSLVILLEGAPKELDQV
jgi:cation diffusion facilitator family transporter